MAMEVSNEVAGLFFVLTGERFPDANEDHLRALAAEWRTAAGELRELEAGLRTAVTYARTTFDGGAERAFADRMAKWVEGAGIGPVPNGPAPSSAGGARGRGGGGFTGGEISPGPGGNGMLSSMAFLFDSLADFLEKLAEDVEYVKLVIIYQLTLLLFEIALAYALSPFTGGLVWKYLAAKFLIVKRLMAHLLGMLLLQFAVAWVIGSAFQLLVDMLAQSTQFGMGTRDDWNEEHTRTAAEVGAVGAGISLILGPLHLPISRGVNSVLGSMFNKKFDDFGKNVAIILGGGLHESLTDMTYTGIKEHKFSDTWYGALTAGMASGAANVLGEFLFKIAPYTDFDFKAWVDRHTNPRGPLTSDVTSPLIADVDTPDIDDHVADSPPPPNGPPSLNGASPLNGLPPVNDPLPSGGPSSLNGPSLPNGASPSDGPSLLNGPLPSDGPSSLNGPSPPNGASPLNGLVSPDGPLLDDLSDGPVFSGDQLEDSSTDGRAPRDPFLEDSFFDDSDTRGPDPDVSVLNGSVLTSDAPSNNPSPDDPAPSSLDNAPAGGYTGNGPENFIRETPAVEYGVPAFDDGPVIDEGWWDNTTPPAGEAWPDDTVPARSIQPEFRETDPGATTTTTDGDNGIIQPDTVPRRPDTSAEQSIAPDGTRPNLGDGLVQQSSPAPAGDPVPDSVHVEADGRGAPLEDNAAAGGRSELTIDTNVVQYNLSDRPVSPLTDKQPPSASTSSVSPLSPARPVPPHVAATQPPLTGPIDLPATTAPDQRAVTPLTSGGATARRMGDKAPDQDQAVAGHPSRQERHSSASPADHRAPGQARSHAHDYPNPPAAPSRPSPPRVAPSSERFGPAGRERRGDDILANQRWRRSTLKAGEVDRPNEIDASWMKPLASPVTHAEIDQVRSAAPVANVDTEVFHPVVGNELRDRLDGGKAIYLARPIRHKIAYGLRTMEVRPGQWVREWTIRVNPKMIGSVPEWSIQGLISYAQEELDEFLNLGYRAPDGAQIHLRVELARPGDPGAIDVEVRPDVTGVVNSLFRWYPRTWSKNARGVLAHELGHAAGMVDEGLDTAYGPKGNRFFQARDPRTSAHYGIDPRTGERHRVADLENNVMFGGLYGGELRNDQGTRVDSRTFFPRYVWRMENVRKSLVDERPAYYDELHDNALTRSRAEPVSALGDPNDGGSDVAEWGPRQPEDWFDDDGESEGGLGSTLFSEERAADTAAAPAVVISSPLSDSGSDPGSGSVAESESESEAGPAGPDRDEAPVAKPAVLIHPDYASGDQFTVAAILINEPDRHVVITHRGESDEAANKIKSFHRESGIDEDRIHVVPEAGVGNFLSNHHGERWNDSSGTKRRIEDIFRTSVGGATRRLAKTFDVDMREKVREGWGLKRDPSEPNERDVQVKSWLKSKGVSKVKGKRIAILWSRFSGKKGEVHIEHDTSYMGMAQIIAGLGKLDYVLIVGDYGREKRPAVSQGGKSSQPQGKFQQIADYYNTGAAQPERFLKYVLTDGRDPDKRALRRFYADFHGKVVDLTEFWDEPAVKEWGGAARARTGQFLLFDYLNRRGAFARHLGFRSGNLEAMALMGFTVRYLEEPRSLGRPRMEAWHDVGNQKTATGGDAPGYERFLAGTSPTRSGQHELTFGIEARKARQHDRTKRVPQKAPGDKFEGGSSRTKGFSDADLENIDAYLVHGDPARGLDPRLVEAVKALESEVKQAGERSAVAFQRSVAGYIDLMNETWSQDDALTRALHVFAPTVTGLLAPEPEPDFDPDQPSSSTAAQ